MRRQFRVALIVLALFAALALTSCGGEEPQAGRQKLKDPASEPSGGPTTAQAPEPVGLGETAEVGHFAVTLNSATRRTTGDSRYAVVDLTLENRSRGSADASEADYLLRDAEGYSFEQGSAPDQRPHPAGQVEPQGKASGQVGFELGDQPADGRLELAVSLSDEPQAARFEFEAEEAKKAPQSKPEPQPEPEAAEKEETPGPSVRPDYSLVEDPSGSLSVEVPSSWSSETGADSEKQGGEGSYSYYAGEYLSASITTATILDAWYVVPGSVEASGAYLVASETLARQYTSDELIYSLLNQKRATNCTAGPSQNLDRPPYSGKVQAWFDCNGTSSTSYSFAAAPEGRACVVVGGRGSTKAPRRRTGRRWNTSSTASRSTAGPCRPQRPSHPRRRPPPLQRSLLRGPPPPRNPPAPTPTRQAAATSGPCPASLRSGRPSSTTISWRRPKRRRYSTRTAMGSLARIWNPAWAEPTQKEEATRRRNPRTVPPTPARPRPKSRAPRPRIPAAP